MPRLSLEAAFGRVRSDFRAGTGLALSRVDRVEGRIKIANRKLSIGCVLLMGGALTNCGGTVETKGEGPGDDRGQAGSGFVGVPVTGTGTGGAGPIAGSTGIGFGGYVGTCCPGTGGDAPGLGAGGYVGVPPIGGEGGYVGAGGAPGGGEGGYVGVPPEGGAAGWGNEAGQAGVANGGDDGF